MALQSSKIIVTGAINGDFPAAFDKISALHKKNAFSFGVVAGDLFANPLCNATDEDDANVTSLIDGKIDIPLPIYFMQGASPLPYRIIEKLKSNDDVVCENLYFLGKRDSLKTSEGVKIVCFGGSMDPAMTGLSTNKYSPFYSEEDAKDFRVKSADIFLTSQWPSGIRTGSSVELAGKKGEFPGSDAGEQPCVADLCSRIRPKYHFSTTPSAFFEREPFFYPPTGSGPDIFPITRFISLASHGNPLESKWIYAFTLDPYAAPSVTAPVDMKVSPFPYNTDKHSTMELVASSSSAQGNTDAHPHPDAHNDSPRPFKRRRRSIRAPRPPPSQCFFCFANPNMVLHLVVSVGQAAYLTTAKGPLSTANTFPELGSPGHMLIIPLAHEPTLASIVPTQNAPATPASTHQEMMHYWWLLNSLLAKKAAGRLGSVTWEVSRTRMVHTHWQYLPVPVDLVRNGEVEAAFKAEAAKMNYPEFREGDVRDGTHGPNANFFRVIIWAPEQENKDPTSVPITEETGPAAEETGSAAEETGPATEKTAPTTKETSPATEETTPTTKETAPVAEEANASAEKIAPAPEDTSSTADQSNPATKETAAIAEVFSPVTEETASTTEKTGPAVEQTGPPTEETPHTTKKTVAVAEEAHPATEETDSVTDESASATGETASVADESGSVTDESGSAIDETASATGETADSNADGGEEANGNNNQAIVKMLYMPVDNSMRFDLQFGRKIMAQLLGLEERVQWQNCGESREDEIRDVEAMKRAWNDLRPS